MELSQVQIRFIEKWGNMGSRWGINRSAAAVHALLYLSPEEMTAEDISLALSMARSNVSQALKELEGWGLVLKESRIGDRKAYYSCVSDVWEMARLIVEERKKREADGVLKSVAECLSMAREAKDSFAEKRLEAMEEILRKGCDLADLALRCKPAVWRMAMKTVAKLFRSVGH